MLLKELEGKSLMECQSILDNKGWYPSDTEEEKNIDGYDFVFTTFYKNEVIKAHMVQETLHCKYTDKVIETQYDMVDGKKKYYEILSIEYKIRMR